MSTKDRNIEHLIEKIIFLLKDNNCPDGMVIFRELLRDCNIKKQEEVAKKILSVYGGMWSFNDLVIQKDYKILVQEDEELDKLRHELYNACVQIAPRVRGEK